MPVVQIVSWAAFHRMDDPAGAAKEKHNMSNASSEPLPRISFVDCEGQGASALRQGPLHAASDERKHPKPVTRLVNR